jgi:putative endonuclease
MRDASKSGPHDRLDLGRVGEDAALAHYLERGFCLVARNWRCSLGELDLILRRESLLVFCEVKTRRGTALGGPYEAVHAAKQRKVRALAQAFLTQVPQAAGIRFDVASVILPRSGPPLVHVFDDAF